MINILKKTRFWPPLTCQDKGLLGCKAGTIKEQGKGRNRAENIIRTQKQWGEGKGGRGDRNCGILEEVRVWNEGRGGSICILHCPEFIVFSTYSPRLLNLCSTAFILCQCRCYPPSPPSQKCGVLLLNFSTCSFLLWAPWSIIIVSWDKTSCSTTYWFMQSAQHRS